MLRQSFQHLIGIERKRISATPITHARLHRLERPEPWHEPILSQIRKMPMDCVTFYPHYPAFYERLARHENVSTHNLVVGAGIEDLIRSLIMLCCDPGEAVAFTYPTCAMFDVYSHVFALEPVHIVTDPEALLTVDDVCRHLKNNVRLLILPNPGQPVETCFDIDQLTEIAVACEKIKAVLAIDEAYFGFGAPTAKDLALEFENVVVLRTFSKAFGAAGIRVGYAIGSDRIIRSLDAIRLSGEVAGPSMYAASVLLDMWFPYVRDGIEGVCEGRDWLRASLVSDGFIANGSIANHVLVRVANAQEAWAGLREKGWHVRMNNEPLSGYLLITCGSQPLMNRFYREFIKLAS